MHHCISSIITLTNMKKIFFGKALIISFICATTVSCSDNDDLNNNVGNLLPANKDSVCIFSEINNSELIFVEKGTFFMGAQAEDPNSPNFDSQACSDESSVHQVSVSSFYIMKNEVTQALWKYVMTNISSDSIKDSEYLYPVTDVSYTDVVNKFIPRLKEITNIAYRLPTEAEWEYAARGGQHNEYTRSMGQFGEYFKFAGSNNASDVASFGLNENSQIGTKIPNELGLYDMCGNVWEWCNDWYSDNYSVNHVINPQGADNGEKRVVRGGSWNLLNDSHCRISYKSAIAPEYKCEHIGFRLVVSAN